MNIVKSKTSKTSEIELKTVDDEKHSEFMYERTDHFSKSFSQVDIDPKNQSNDFGIGHEHFSHRTGWIRAGVLGANDGLVSVASLIMGVGASEELKTVVLSAVAGLVAGALSMALGEYVSVYSTRDAQKADIQRERDEFLKGPIYQEKEKLELAALFEEKGISKELSLKVAEDLHKHSLDTIIQIHAREEFGVGSEDLANPGEAAIVSAVAFALGAAIPILAASFIASASLRLVVVFICTSIGLLVFGASGAILGGAPWPVASLRVLLGGWIAMGVTFGIGLGFSKALGTKINA
jgi:VIT1/CCC1 family predicted Fe2+/Mn2+ transporter